MKSNKPNSIVLDRSNAILCKRPLHLAQQEVYYDQITNKENPSYNVGGYVIFKGDLNKKAFFQVITQLPQSFDVLRMRFHFDKDEPQCSLDHELEELEISELDFSLFAEPKVEALAWMQGRFNQVFDITQGGVLHEQFLLKIAKDEHWWYQRFHHLITDGYGFVSLHHHVAKQYSQLVARDFTPPVNYPQYIDEIQQAINYEGSDSYQRDEEYWYKQFENIKEPLLRGKKIRKTDSSSGSGRFFIKIPQQQRQLWEAVAKQTNTSIQQLTLAAFTLYFGRTEKREELVFGTTLHKRRNKRQRTMVGMFSGMLPFKGKYDASKTLEDLLLEVKQQQRQDYRYQNYPISHLNRKLKLLATGQKQLFEVVVNYANLDFELDFVGLETQSYELSSDQENVPLQFWWRDYGQQQDLELRVDFGTSYFIEEEAKLLCQRILFILDQFPTRLKQQLGQLEIIPRQEKHRLLTELNKTVTNKNLAKTVVSLFEEQVNRVPTHVALTFGNEQITYQELNERANQLARYLISKGVKPKSFIAICLERSMEMIVGILGILKAGAVYVPLDPDYPQSRIDFMLADTQTKWLITEKKHQARFEGFTNCVFLDHDYDLIKTAQKHDVTVSIEPSDPIYVIYTSGSTGKPKGVLLKHVSIINLIQSRTAEFRFDDTESVLQFSNIAFDASVEQIFLALLNGATLVLLNKEELLDTSRFQQLLVEKGITHLDVTPGFLEHLTQGDYPDIRRIVVGGEVCRLSLAERWSTKYPFYNAYGPTETAVTSLTFKYDSSLILGNTLPIGRPIDNTQVLVLDEEQQLVPISQVGELYIGGVGLASAYLNQPALTAERFLEIQGKKYYRTGDLVAMQPDGLLVYQGRADDQVKIRGHRIELGEVEAVLQQLPQVKQAVVLVQENSASEKQLAAYIVPQTSFDTFEIQQQLRQQLPQYMLPSYMMELDELPLNSSGKIDKKSLPSPDASTLLTQQYRAPRSAKEETLVDIWESLLAPLLIGSPEEQIRIGIDDNFFELGGHSLLATRLVSTIRERLKVEIAIKDVFQFPTIASLSVLLEGKVQSQALPKISQYERPKYVPLAFSQERIWFIDQLEGSSHYHMPGVFKFNGSLNEQVLEQAFNTIINRHEALRTVIKQENERPFQSLIEQDCFKLHIDHYDSHLPAHKLDELIEKLSQQAFDLSTDHMIRVRLMKFPNNDCVLLVLIHHIAADGWSLSVLLNELVTSYRSLLADESVDLVALPLQFADFALWQRQALSGNVLEGQLNYWEEKLKGVSPLNLPLDFPRPAIQKLKGSTIHLSLNQEITEQLHQLSKNQGVTLFMTLLSAFKVLLYRYSGQSDICVGTAIANRQQKEMEGLIGFFVNTLALRSNLDGNPSFTELLNRVKTTTLDAYAYQDAPFDKVVDRVEPERELNRNPLFQVMFVLQNTPEMQPLQLGDTLLELEPLTYQMAKFDLTFTLEESANGLAIEVEYSNDLFLKSTIQRLIGHYQNLLHAIVQNPSIAIAQLPILGETEYKQLCVDFSHSETVAVTPKTVIDLFEEQVRLHPNRIAVVFEGTEMSFSQLNVRANQLAHYLAKRGVVSQDLVAVCLKPSMEMVSSVLAILKIAAVYVPLDPSHPQKRIDYILEDTKAACLITAEEVLETIAINTTSDVLSADRESVGIGNMPSVNYEHKPTTNQAAYVIYTSGSTGRPKGVLINHSSLTNYLTHSALNYLDPKKDFTEGSGSYVHLSSTFDASLTALFTPLIRGKSIVISSKSGLDVFDDPNFVKYAPYDFIKLTPAHMQLLRPLVGSGLTSLTKRLVLGGEALQVSDFQYFVDEGINLEIVNEYGPTEATVGCTTYTFNTLDHVEIGLNGVLIGKPTGNVEIYLLDQFQQAVPIGVAGELCIGGLQLAQAYLNQPELTKEKFILHPFKNEGKLYKTGDLARWRSDGKLEYLGRIDHQVKLNGYRIELGEIEYATQQLNTVTTSCVVVKEDENSKKLIHYFVPDITLLKAQAIHLHEKQVSNWQDLYVEEYKDSSFVSDEEFNVTGWGDSFTGGQIPDNHMAEWLDDIIQTILAKPTQKVLEIGCGTGLIYYRLADHIAEYTGFDLSITAINQIESRIAKAEKTYPKTELAACPAHEITLSSQTDIDTIVINSVVQYFPGEEYLSDILDKSITSLQGKGRVIVGDVRHFGLLTDFRRHVQLGKAHDRQGIQDFEWQVSRAVLNDKELCIAPEFFYQLQDQYPEISHIAIEYKQAKHINEMSLYRYNVVIYVGADQAVESVNWKSWDTFSSMQQFEEELRTLPEQLAISDVPNPRLWKERLLAKGLEKPSITTVKELKTYATHEAEGNRLIHLLEEAETLGYTYRMLVHENPMKVNLFLDRSSGKKLLVNHFDTSTKINKDVSNIPLFIEAALVIQQETKQKLEELLPTYMLPAKHIAVQQLPLTANGKVDRNFLSQLETGVTQSEANYQAPTSAAELVLADIWANLLHIEKVGIHDNFFALGGDSIITIQVVSRAKQAGYQLETRDLFKHQTIASLAKILKENSSRVSITEQGTLTGKSALLPIQHWFFEKNLTEKSWYNQGVLLEFDKRISQDSLKHVFQALLLQHDALRFEYHQEDGAWEQYYGSHSGEFEVMDLSTLSQDELPHAISQICESNQQKLNIEKGQLVKLMFLTTPDWEPKNRLFIVIHHLAVDGVSWRILLQHLELGIQQVMNGEAVDLGTKSSSYRNWVQALSDDHVIDKMSLQIGFWQKTLDLFESLPTDFAETESKMSDTTTHQVALSIETTTVLLQRANKAYHTEINDLLLTAFAKTLLEYFGKQQFTIGLEGHGRENIIAGLDTSSTVGWFTSLFPVGFELEQDLAVSDLIKSVKEQLRAVPDKGIGYGVLRYLHPDATIRESLSVTAWDVVFNYLGQLDNAVQSSANFSIAQEAIGNSISSNCPFEQKLEVNSSIVQGQLNLAWTYSKKQYKSETIQTLANSFMVNLSEIVAHCQSQTHVVNTPSDFGLNKWLSYRDLDEFMQEREGETPRLELINSLYPLSPMQEGLLFYGLLNQESEAYLEQTCVDLPQGVDITALNASWNVVLQHHSILRSAFYPQTFSIPVQVVYNSVELPFELLDFSAVPIQEQEAKVAAFLEQDRQKGFNFEQAPLMRISLLKLSPMLYKLVWTTHHMLVDGWTSAIIFGELLAAYEDFVSGNQPFERAVDQYQDFIYYLQAQDVIAAQQFWEKQLADFETPSLLPFVTNTSNRNQTTGDAKEDILLFDSEFHIQIKQYVKAQHITINTLLQGVWAMLLSRYTGLSDVVFGATVSGRPSDLENAEQRVGLFINTIPVRAKLPHDEKISTWLVNLQNDHALAREYQYNGLHDIQKWSGIKGELFDSLLVFENYPMEGALSKGWKLKMENLTGKEQTNYPLSIIAAELNQQLSIKFNYNSALLDATTVAQIKGHFETAILHSIEQPQLCINELEIVSAQEREKLLIGFNKTDASYPEDKTVVQLFEYQVIKSPLSIALSFEGQEMSYQDLDEKANQLAHYLRQQRVNTGDFVGISMHRSLDLIVGILGILKAGGVYVPIDPTYPQERRHFLLEDADVNLVLVDSDTKSLMSNELDKQLVILNEEWAEIANNPTEKLPLVQTAQDLVYMMYTSGSTGHPKGVYTKHQAISRLIFNPSFEFLDEQSVLYQFAPTAFDASTFEIWGALLKGGKLVISSTEQKSLEAMAEELKYTGVNVLWLTAGLFHEVVDAQIDLFDGLNYLLAGGDSIRPDQVKKLLEHHTTLTFINGYGPTESTTFAVVKPIRHAHEVSSINSIGKPIGNTKAYVLQPQTSLLSPMGCQGELCLSGAGLALAYHKQPELTAQKFIDNPFIGAEHNKIYRTGDLVRWLPSGELEFLGRIDHQVKVRGYRVELGEIESVLHKVTSISQAVVLAPEAADGNKQLVAYIVPSEGYQKASVQEYLNKQLPAYMVPSFLVELEKLPLTTNGKVNKKALPQASEFLSMNEAYVAPRNELEEQLVTIWKRLLNLEQVGVFDNFFELGGHSLLVTRLVSEIKRELDMSLELKAVFELTDIASIAQHLQVQQNNTLLDGEEYELIEL